MWPRKHGVVGLTKVVALETAGTGITCNKLGSSRQVVGQTLGLVHLGVVDEFRDSI